MIRLASRQKSPINGFQFHQAQTGAYFKEWSWDILRMKIIQHRQANPRFGLSTDPSQVDNEIDYQNALRMKSIPNADTYVMEDAQPPPDINPHSPLPQGRWPLNAVVGSRLATGAETLADWWLDGAKPVTEETANKRAKICVACPKNEIGDWSSYFTEEASELVRKAVEHRNSLRLSTEFDAKLGICNACTCPMKLKVHVPRATILAHMPPEFITQLHESCWITKDGE